MKSLELNWIRKKCDKTLVMPEVMFLEIDYAGMYIHPEECEYYDTDGHPFYAGNGLIIVDTRYPEDVESTIAHEWRHHWQLFNGFKLEASDWDVEIDDNDYNDHLIKYFTSSKFEMDALRFQYKYSFIDPSWEELLYQYL